MDLTLGELFVRIAMGATFLGLIYATIRYDLVDHRNAPDFRTIYDGLRRGRPIGSQWKQSTKAIVAATPYPRFAFWVLCCLSFAAGG